MQNVSLSASQRRRQSPPSESLTNPAKMHISLGDTPNALDTNAKMQAEIANAELSIAGDNTYVETTSAVAAREVKRRLDRAFHVGEAGRRSPYMITAIDLSNQQVFRVSRRDGQPMVDVHGVFFIDPPEAHEAVNSSRPSFLEGLFSSTSKLRSTLPLHHRPRYSHNYATQGQQSSGSPPSARTIFNNSGSPKSSPDLSQLYGTSGTSTPSHTPLPPYISHHSISSQRAPVVSGPFSRTPLPPDLMPIDSRKASTAASSTSTTSALTVPRPFGPFISFATPAIPSDEPSSPDVLLELSKAAEDFFGKSVESEELRVPKAPRVSGVPILHNAQSFDSTSTARGIRASTPTPANISPPPQKVGVVPPYELLHAVFDVIQRPRGKSLAADASFGTLPDTSLVAPNDDPRFVLWGEAGENIEPLEFLGNFAPSTSTIRRGSDLQGTDMPTSSGPTTSIDLTFLSSGSSSVSHSVTTSSENLSTDNSNPLIAEGRGKPIMLAATIEHWVGQLTSERDSDALLDFFLTYRAFVSPVELVQILIARFHWTLAPSVEPSSTTTPNGDTEGSNEDANRTKKIIRVRTFGALKYWLLTFFTVDFIPHPSAGQVLTTWLNLIDRSPLYQSYGDVKGMIRTLKGIVMECKKTNMAEGRSRLSAAQRKLTPDGQMPSRSRSPMSLAFSPFLAALLPEFEDLIILPEDRDVDLDFSIPISKPGSISAGQDGENTHSSGNPYTPAVVRGRAGSGSLLKREGGMLPVTRDLTASQAGLLQPFDIVLPALPRALPKNGSSAASTSAASLHPTHSDSKVSRVFVNTIGKFSRWKRVRNELNIASAFGGVETPEYGLELNAAGNLSVRGGLEGYFQLMGLKPIPQTNPHSPPVADATVGPEVGRASTFDVTTVNETQQRDLDVDESTVDVAKDEEPGPSPSDTAVASLRTPERTDSNESSLQIENQAPNRASVASSSLSDDSVSAYHYVDLNNGGTGVVHNTFRQSIASWRSSLSSLGNLLPRRSFADATRPPPGLFEVVPLDDYHLSESDDEGPGDRQLRRMPRRLPLRRDLQFVRRSIDSLTSLGVHSTTSDLFHSTERDHRDDVEASRPVMPWQLYFLRQNDSDDEPGDAEAALRKLEGQVNQSDKGHMEKIDGWLKQVEDRLEAEDRGVDFSAEDERMRREIEASLMEDSTESVIEPSTSVDDQPIADSGKDDDGATGSIVEPEMSNNDAVTEIALPEDSQESENVDTHNTPFLRPLSNPLASKPVRPWNEGKRSFIFEYRSEVLAHHFTDIDRNLLLRIKFEHLLSYEWARPVSELVVLDWSQFHREIETARREAERNSDQNLPVMNDVLIVRARFIMMSNFVATEIAFSPMNERVSLFTKFIRVAWKLYSLNNFASLTAVVAGLQSEPVHLAMQRSWDSVGRWEARVLRDLRAFTSSKGNYHHIRASTAELVAARSFARGSGKAQEAEPACIPLLNIYLHEFYEYAMLPTFVDPTSPHIRITSSTPPRCPEVFSALPPLPDSVPLRPLINVHKQRLIAGLVKDVATGQHLAANHHPMHDGKLFKLCWSLRASEPSQLSQVASL